jgi:hypothetical protein
MLREALVQLPLDSAFLCAEPACKTVSNNSSACPRRHSAVLSLARVLGDERASDSRIGITESLEELSKRGIAPCP